MGGFAENLKRIRLSMDMSQEDFAKLLRTSKQNISRYESGQVSPKISTASEFADILGVSLSELSGERTIIVHGASDALVKNLAQRSYASRKRKQLADLLDQIPDDKADLVIRILESILADSQK